MIPHVQSKGIAVYWVEYHNCHRNCISVILIYHANLEFKPQKSKKKVFLNLSTEYLLKIYLMSNSTQYFE